jgi:hypothetical protein
MPVGIGQFSCSEDTAKYGLFEAHIHIYTIIMQTNLRTTGQLHKRGVLISHLLTYFLKNT